MKYIITESKLHTFISGYLDSEFRGLQRKHMDFGITYFYNSDGELLFHLVEREKRNLLRLCINRDLISRVSNIFNGQVSLGDILDIIELTIKKYCPDINYDEVTVG